MISVSDAKLRHSVCFYNILLKINHDYLQEREPIFQALSDFDLNWENIQKGQGWAANCPTQNQMAAYLSRRYAALEILDLRQDFQERSQWLEG
jgi:hypothetical protein